MSLAPELAAPRGKILRITASSNPTAGGPIEGLLQTARRMARQGYETDIACLDVPGSPWLEGSSAGGIRIHALGSAASKAQRWNPLSRYGHSPGFQSWLDAHLADYDCAIVHGLWHYATFAASRALRRKTIPYLVFTHGMMDPWFRRRYPHKHLAKQALWLACEGPLLANANAVLFTSEEERRLARGVFLGHSYVEQVIAYGTAEPPPAKQAHVDAFRATVPALADRQFLLFLSRIHPKKGCDLLVQAFANVAAAHPHLDLVIAGPDQVGWKAKLQVIAAELGIADRIHWPGMLTNDTKWGAFRSAEAFVLPSHQENFGIVVAEAMACGTPVLVTDKVNIWREVEAAGAGLVASDDIEGVTNLLVRFLSLDADAKAQLGEHGLAGFHTHFNVDMATQELVAAIETARGRT